MRKQQHEDAKPRAPERVENEKIQLVNRINSQFAKPTRTRRQKGCIREERGRWCLRWRETVRGENDEPTRIPRFKVLADVTAEHRRNKDRTSGKLRIPPEIAKMAQDILEPINLASGPAETAIMTIGTLVNQYFEKIVEPHRKPSTLKCYRDIWRVHLKHRIGQQCVSDLDLAGASLLWEGIVRDNKFWEAPERVSVKKGEAIWNDVKLKLQAPSFSEWWKKTKAVGLSLNGEVLYVGVLKDDAKQEGESRKIQSEIRTALPTTVKQVEFLTQVTLNRRSMSHIRFFVSGVYVYAKNRGLFKGENPAGAALPEGLRGGKPGAVYSMDELNRMLEVLQQERENKTVFLEQIKKEHAELARTKPNDKLEIKALKAKLHRAEGALVEAFKAEAILAMAFGSGLRKGELQGLTWENFRVQKDGSAKVIVAQSVWHGKVITPKTEASIDVVDLGEEFVQYIEQYRAAIGGVDSGFMFGYASDRPIDLDSFYRWTMVPLLNRCSICKRPEAAHGEESTIHRSRETKHEYVRDESMPVWKGYHAYRRGAATHLAKNFGSSEGVKAASKALRHADESVTQNHYVKESKLMTRARAAAKQIEIEKLKREAAGVLTQGLRAVR